MRNRSIPSSSSPRRASGPSDAGPHPQAAPPVRPAHKDHNPQPPALNPTGPAASGPLHDSRPHPGGAGASRRAGTSGPGMAQRRRRSTTASPAGSSPTRPRPTRDKPGHRETPRPHDHQVPPHEAAQNLAATRAQTTSHPHPGQQHTPGGFVGANEPILTVTAAQEWVDDGRHNTTPAHDIPDFVGANEPLPDVTITPAKNIGVPDPAQLPTNIGTQVNIATTAPPRQTADPTRPRPNVNDPSDYHADPPTGAWAADRNQGPMGAVMQPSTPRHPHRQSSLPLEPVPSPVRSGSIPITPTHTSQFAAATVAAAIIPTTTVLPPKGAQRLSGADSNDAVTLPSHATDAMVLPPLREHHTTVPGPEGNNPSPARPSGPTQPAPVTAPRSPSDPTTPKPGSRRAQREQRRSNLSAQLPPAEQVYGSAGAQPPAPRHGQPHSLGDGDFVGKDDEPVLPAEGQEYAAQTPHPHHDHHPSSHQRDGSNHQQDHNPARDPADHELARPSQQQNSLGWAAHDNYHSEPANQPVRRGSHHHEQDRSGAAVGPMKPTRPGEGMSAPTRPGTPPQPQPPSEYAQAKDRPWQPEHHDQPAGVTAARMHPHPLEPHRPPGPSRAPAGDMGHPQPEPMATPTRPGHGNVRQDHYSQSQQYGHQQGYDQPGQYDHQQPHPQPTRPQRVGNDQARRPTRTQGSTTEPTRPSPPPHDNYRTSSAAARPRRGVTLDHQQVTASQEGVPMPGHGESIMGRPTRPTRH